MAGSSSSSSSSSFPPSPPHFPDVFDDQATRGVSISDSSKNRKKTFKEFKEDLLRQRSSSGHPLCDHADESCIAHAIGNLCQSFLLAYGVRVGIGILRRAFKLGRHKSYSSLFDIKQLVSEKDLIVREEACRVGLLFGGFTGSYHLLRCLLRRLRKKETPINPILAGSVAGLSIVALDDPSRRRFLALYLLARLAQCAYNSSKFKNKFRRWSRWGHGDSLLFSLASAQVMYAFVMRPESLPESYRDFVQKTGPVVAPVYKAVRDCCRGFPVDVVSLNYYLSQRRGPRNVKLEEFPSIIPCSIIHPDASSCISHNASALSTTFQKAFPLYFSLMFVPFIILHLEKFMSAPFTICWHAVAEALRSTSFLSAFVGIFQAVICFQRKVAWKDHKLAYWVAGAMSGLSILMEKKDRRGDFALYVFPLAGQSMWYILVNRRFLPDIKHAEVALFCACMGGIMYYLEHEPQTMGPLLRGLIHRFLDNRINNSESSVSRNASYTYLLELDKVNKPELTDNKEAEASASEKYNLESIPGL